MKMEIKKKVFLRTVSGMDMLIPVGDTVKDYNGIFTLSPTAATAFRAIEKGCDKEGIINAVLDKFGNMPAKTLSDWSHQKGSPWDTARNTTGMYSQISKDVMKLFFKSVLK